MALGADEDGLREWRKALLAPLERSSRGFWTAEARLLYDIQKVCVDHERPFFAVDLFGWATSLGRRPIKRLLPHHQEVLMMQHLRGALKNLTAASRLPEADRNRFTRLLSDAVHQAENRLRDRFRPEIGKVLEQTGFEARNLPERVAFQKINEELLDRVVHRGFLAMGDLRDAVSRNNRKLPDLAGPVEFFSGDRLLLADRRLSARDGRGLPGGRGLPPAGCRGSAPWASAPGPAASSPGTWPCPTAGRSWSWRGCSTWSGRSRTS